MCAWARASARARESSRAGVLGKHHAEARDLRLARCQRLGGGAGQLLEPRAGGFGRRPFPHPALMRQPLHVAVDPELQEMVEDLLPLARLAVQEEVELTLREHDRADERVVVEADGLGDRRLDLARLSRHAREGRPGLLFEDGLGLHVAAGHHRRAHHPVDRLPHLEVEPHLHPIESAGEELVDLPAEPRRAPIEGVDHGVEERGLAGAGGTGDGEEIEIAEVDRGGSAKAGEPRELELERAHQRALSAGVLGVAGSAASRVVMELAEETEELGLGLALVLRAMVGGVDVRGVAAGGKPLGSGIHRRLDSLLGEAHVHSVGQELPHLLRETGDRAGGIDEHPHVIVRGNGGGRLFERGERAAEVAEGAPHVKRNGLDRRRLPRGLHIDEDHALLLPRLPEVEGERRAGEARGRGCGDGLRPVDVTQGDVVKAGRQVRRRNGIGLTDLEPALAAPELGAVDMHVPH